MKSLLPIGACVVALVAVLYCLLSPDGGLMYQSPWMGLSIGLIGLGLYKHARETRAAATGE